MFQCCLFFVADLDAVEVIFDEFTLTLVYYSPLGCTLPAVDMSAFTQTSYVHCLDSECTSR